MVNGLGGWSGEMERTWLENWFCGKVKIMSVDLSEQKEEEEEKKAKLFVSHVNAH